ncbi:unnamed protein product, partial [Owenia fusiformis]
CLHKRSIIIIHVSVAMEGIKYQSVDNSVESSATWRQTSRKDGSIRLNEMLHTDDTSKVSNDKSEEILLESKPRDNENPPDNGTFAMLTNDDIDEHINDDILANEENASIKDETKLDGTVHHMSQPEKKGKLAITFLLYLAVAVVGMVATVIGPTLLDLKDQLGVGNAEMSLSFAFYSGGYALGGLIAGFMASKYDVDPILQLALFLGMGAGFTIAIPWLGNIWAVLVFFSLNGTSFGVIETVSSALLIKIWSPNSGPYIQVFSLSYSVGNTLTSLVARPFVSEIGLSKFNIKNNHSDMTNISLTVSERFGKRSHTYGQQTPKEYGFENEGNMTDLSLSGTGLSNLKESDIGFVYLIIGLLSAAVGLCFLILYILTKTTCTFNSCFNNSTSATKTTNYKEIDDPSNTINDITYAPFAKCYKFQLLATLLLMYFLFAILLMTGGGLVMTFAVEGLKWPKSQGTAIIAAYWGAQIFSKLPSIVILASKILSVNQVIVIDLTLLACSYAVMVIFVQKHYIVIWVTLLTAGL